MATSLYDNVLMVMKMLRKTNNLCMKKDLIDFSISGQMFIVISICYNEFIIAKMWILDY